MNVSDVLVQPLAQPRMSKSPAPPTVISPATSKPKSPADSVVPPLPPSPMSNSPPAHTLATLLSNALVQIDSLKEMLKTEKSRADYYEVLAKDYRDLLGKGASPDAEKNQTENAKVDDKNDVSMDDSRSKDPASQLAAAAEKIRQLRDSVTAAEEVRDEEMARRIAITDLWAQLNQYLERLDSAGKDVRLGYDRVVKSGGGVLRDHSSIFKDFPQLADGELMKYDRIYNANGVLQSLAPAYSSRRHEYPREERHGTRRPRSGSMDAYAYGLGPNSKRVRYQDEHPHHASGSGVSPTYYQPTPHSQHPPPTGGSSHPISPPHIQQHQHAILQNMPYAQGQPQPPPLATASSSSGSGPRHRERRHADPAAIHAPEHQGNVYPMAGPLGYEHPHRSQDHPRDYHDDRRRRRRDRSRSYSPGRSRSRGSEGSMDLDEMLLATTGDEQHMQLNGNGLPGPSQLLVSGRGKGRPLNSHASGLVYDPRDGSQYVSPPSLSPHAQHIPAHHSSQHLGGPPPPQHVVQYGNPQSGPPSGRQSPPFGSSSRPSSSRRVLRSEPTLREDLDRREGSLSQSTAQVQYQTHVFAPVQTGAPVKKTKFNNASGNASNANVAEESHTKSPAPNPAPVAASSSTSSLPLASVNLAPATSPFPPTNEQGQRICRQCGMPGRYKEGKCVEKWGPGPMGPGTVCDRCRKKMKRVERRGTIEQAQLLAAQQAQNRSQTNIGNASSSYGSFPTPQREIQNTKIGRTDTVIIDNGRHTFEEPSVSSIRSTSNARIVTSSPFTKSSKSGSRPTSKAASRAGSIVDGSKSSRRSSPVPSSRSNLGTTMTLSTSRNHASNASVHSIGSGSGMDIDADADGDAEADLDDPEAEVEGDIAALVDQAAPSPPRPHPRSRNDEDVDIAALAGVDDDPDDYDSPATTNALRRQQAARAVGGISAHGPSVSGKDVTSGPSADAELDILEAVDAAEANSATSSGSKVEES